jgi:hypothetical protein
MQQLIARSHETPKAKKAHVKRAWQLFRSLVDRKIIEFVKEQDLEGAIQEGEIQNPKPEISAEGLVSSPDSSRITHHASRITFLQPSSPNSQHPTH